MPCRCQEGLRCPLFHEFAMPPECLPRPRVASAPSQRGFGLFELILVLGAVSVMSLAVYTLFFASDVSADVKNAQKHLGVVSSRIEESFGSTGSYAGVTMNQVVADGLLPDAYTRGGTVQSEWGTGLDVRAHSVLRPNDSFVVEYQQVPTDACTRLAGAAAGNVYDLRISGSTVLSSTGLDPAAVGSQCNRSGGARMEFVYFSGLSTGTAVAVTGEGTTGSEPSAVTPASENASARAASGIESAAQTQTMPASSVGQPGHAPVVGSVASERRPLAADPTAGLSSGGVAGGGVWVLAGEGCEHTTGGAAVDTCAANGHWKAWQDIPNTTGKPLCDQLPGSAIPGTNCVAELRLDTRTPGCMAGSRAVVQVFKVAAAPGGLITSYSLKEYICRG